ncbi:helix-turn-helix domain-containing protein [Acinetobacter baumannii]|uniref:helix-turn-helix domain-containing protein n=1 Tax=Acinetobacter calcoaceticus/baumannii complex TaxID=909768 RepID=UPI0013BE5921|nr:helix-turn-helix domain-containing protein [Acinetobacter baumannii]NDX18472.1 helix-turn-helix domain-containing protein [Acinetobacter baumannii]NDX37874.1 helix-turn-helix domain-containing protein [Acinetobacter baumannii]
MATREEIGKEIRLARKALGYTQKNLSEKTNVNKTTISETENGHFTGSFSIFEIVLNAVGLQFEVDKKKYKFPHWDEIEAMFAEDDE